MKPNKYQKWPDKKNWSSALAWMRGNARNLPNVSKRTKIASMGSCFAREVKNWLIEKKYNYLIGENKKNPWVSHHVFKGDGGVLPSSHASVAWERVYNTFTLRQIIDYTFNNSRLESRLLEVNCRDQHNKMISDILRTRILYADFDSAKEDVEDHIRESARVFLETEILIVTLGLTEIWESQKRNIVIASHPGKHYELPKDFHFRVSSFAENLANLKYALSVLKAHNKKIQVIVTVSPVHLLATHRTDLDVISASCSSKSTLRAVVDEFQKLDGVHYFPSYEIATIAAALDGVVMYPDNHHVSRDVVGHIMDIFESKCSRGFLGMTWPKLSI